MIGSLSEWWQVNSFIIRCVWAVPHQKHSGQGVPSTKDGLRLSISDMEQSPVLSEQHAEQETSWLLTAFETISKAACRGKLFTLSNSSSADFMLNIEIHFWRGNDIMSHESRILKTIFTWTLFILFTVPLTVNFLMFKNCTGLLSTQQQHRRAGNN